VVVERDVGFVARQGAAGADVPVEDHLDEACEDGQREAEALCEIQHWRVQEHA
jgi:hypothetical protein